MLLGILIRNSIEISDKTMSNRTTGRNCKTDSMCGRSFIGPTFNMTPLLIEFTCKYLNTENCCLWHSITFLVGHGVTVQGYLELVELFNNNRYLTLLTMERGDLSKWIVTSYGRIKDVMMVRLEIVQWSIAFVISFVAMIESRPNHCSKTLRIFTC